METGGGADEDGGFSDRKHQECKADRLLNLLDPIILGLRIRF
jgi:hypothetical protein